MGIVIMSILALICTSFPAHAAGRAATYLRFKVSSSAVSPGSLVVTTVNLSKEFDATPIRSASVSVQYYSPGTKRWVSLGAVKTDRTGSGTARFKPARTMKYRAVFSGTKALEPTVSAEQTITIKTPSAVTARIANSKAQIGSTTSISGNLTAGGTGRSGGQVLIERQSGRTWTSVKAATTASAGAYSVKVSVTGSAIYRATFAGSRQFLSSVSKSVALTASAYPGTSAWGGHRYRIFTDKLTYSAASSACVARGGYLARIDSSQENSYLYGLMRSKGFDSAYFGLSDARTEGVWLLSNGKRPSYTNWAPGEPNSETSAEDYAMFYWKFTDGTWNDGSFGGSVGETEYMPYFCEW